jgi:hypothetical protein
LGGIRFIGVEAFHDLQDFVHGVQLEMLDESLDVLPIDAKGSFTRTWSHTLHRQKILGSGAVDSQMGELRQACSRGFGCVGLKSFYAIVQPLDRQSTLFCDLRG